jgi:hypothetical protein
MTKKEYEMHTRIVVLALFPNLSPTAIDALVVLIADFLMSLDAMAASE